MSGTPEDVNMPDQTPSPVEYALGLSDEDKSWVFCALLKQLIASRNGGQGPIPITAPDGEDLGYHVAPPAAQAYFEAYGPKLSEEEWAELDRRAASVGTAISTEQMIAELRAEAERLKSRELERCAS